MSYTSTIVPPSSNALSRLPNSQRCDLTAPTNEREETLRDLLVAHHGTAAPLREPNLTLHDHMPHILCSGFDIGQDSDMLTETYETVLQTLIKINHKFPRGAAIEGHRLKDYFWKKEYTVAFVDFFDEEFRGEDGNWKKAVHRYLYEQDKPLMNGIVGGLGHPMIHLAYAYDFNCKEIASEGMSLLCTDYFDLHTVMDEPQPDTSTYKTTSLAEVFERVCKDSRFDNLREHPGIVELPKVMELGGDAIIEHWNAWEVNEPLQQLEHVCDLATLVAMTTYDSEKEFDFFLLHLMTVAHALRSMWHHIPAEKHVPMLREYGLMATSLYVCQQRPAIRTGRITGTDVQGRDWEWVKRTARNHPAKFDVHFFKAIRAPQEFEKTWGHKDGLYLKAAVQFLEDFGGWTGFGEGILGFDEKSEGWSAKKSQISESRV